MTQRAVPGPPSVLVATSGVRHDLGHVLSTLQALLAVAESPAATPPDQIRHLVATARREAGLALELLALLPTRDDDGARADEAAVMPASVCDLAEVLHAAAGTVAPTGPTVVVRSRPPLLVPMSHTAMTRVVRNLLTNATAAAGAVGSVELRGRRVRSTGRHGDRRSFVRLEVHDDGPGFPVRGAYRPGGMGLSVVRSLVLPAGGWLVLGRSPRGGACACVTLPEARPEVSA
jgi:signal transduction histidine kinase